MNFSALLLKVDIHVVLDDADDHFCRLTHAQIEQDDFKQTHLIPQLSQRFFRLSRFNLTESEVSRSLAKQSDQLTQQYIEDRALCQYHVATVVLLTQKDSVHITVNIRLSPNTALNQL